MTTQEENFQEILAQLEADKIRLQEKFRNLDYKELLLMEQIELNKNK